MAPAAAASCAPLVLVSDAGEGRSRETPRSAERAVSSGASRSRAVTTDPPAGALAPAQGEPQQGSGTPSGASSPHARQWSGSCRQTRGRRWRSPQHPRYKGTRTGRCGPTRRRASFASRTEADRTAVTAAPAWPGTDSGSAREPSPTVRSTPVSSSDGTEGGSSRGTTGPFAERAQASFVVEPITAIAAEAAVPSTVPGLTGTAPTPGRGASESTSRNGSGPARIDQPLPASSWPTDDARPTATGGVPAAGPVSARQALINRLLEREAQRGGRPTFAASRPAPAEPSAPPSLGSPPSTPSASAPAPTSSVPPSAAAPAVPVPDTPLPGLAPNAPSPDRFRAPRAALPYPQSSHPVSPFRRLGGWPGDTPGLAHP